MNDQSTPTYTDWYPADAKLDLDSHKFTLSRDVTNRIAISTCSDAPTPASAQGLRPVDSGDALRATSHAPCLPSARAEAVTAQTAADTIHLRLSVTPHSAPILRSELADWLHHLVAATSTIFELQLACTEVLTIMIGQSGHRTALVMELQGTMTDNTATITMHEYGLCRQPGHLPNLDHALSLNLIEAMTDTLDIHEHTHGRTFTLRRTI